MGHVVSLLRYPLKSAHGEQLRAVYVDVEGVRGDRSWACLDDADGTVGSAKHPERWGRLLEVTAQVDEHSSEVVVQVQGRRAVAGSEQADALLKQAPRAAGAVDAVCSGSGPVAPPAARGAGAGAGLDDRRRSRSGDGHRGVRCSASRPLRGLRAGASAHHRRSCRARRAARARERGRDPLPTQPRPRRTARSGAWAGAEDRRRRLARGPAHPAGASCPASRTRDQRWTGSCSAPWPGTTGPSWATWAGRPASASTQRSCAQVSSRSARSSGSRSANGTGWRPGKLGQPASGGVSPGRSVAPLMECCSCPSTSRLPMTP